MGRRLRYIPEDGSLVEVTCRTVHSRFLLRPSAELNEIVAGVLGRAQRLYEVAICSYSFLSNHYHLLLYAKDAGQLMRFMAYLNSNLARETGRLHGWRDKIWSRRYQAIVISPEEPAQIERLRYVLANGCKEGLVGRPRDWPGVHAARDLMSGQAWQGYWFSRTQEYAARRRGETFDRLKYATPETVVLSPLPCWNHLPAEDWRRLTLHLIHEIEEAAAARLKAGSQPLGASAIRGQHPHDRPASPKRSPAPLFHAASAKMYKELLGSLRLVRRGVPAGL